MYVSWWLLESKARLWKKVPRFACWRAGPLMTARLGRGVEEGKRMPATSSGSEPAIVEKDVLPLPTNEILVKVHAASINPCDIQLWRSGLVAVVAGDKGMGKDFSGTVVAVGEKVTGWAEGDEIFGLLFHIVSLLCQSPNVTDTW